jgi:hypothetical protein
MRPVHALLLLGSFTFGCTNGGDDKGDTDVADTDVAVGDTDVAVDDTDVTGGDTDVADTDTCAGVVDECGVCDGDNADKDCAGTCFGAAVADACGTCDDTFGNDCVPSFTTSASWNCGFGESCQDTYTFDVAAGTTLTIDVTDLTDSSAVRTSLFAPGVALGGVNLFTGANNDRGCTGKLEPEHIVYTVKDAGVYTLAVGRYWAESGGDTGTYTLQVQGDPGLRATATVADDAAESAGNVVCDFAWSAFASWDCATGESCRDVYDVELPAGVELGIDVLNLGGSSVPMLAVYAPGVALDGENKLIGSNNDFTCSGQDEEIIGTVTTDAAGVWRVAVGRDWGSSSGGAGTYQVVLTEAGAFNAAVQTVEDVDSEAAGAVCPL